MNLDQVHKIRDTLMMILRKKAESGDVRAQTASSLMQQRRGALQDMREALTKLREEMGFFSGVSAHTGVVTSLPGPEVGKTYDAGGGKSQPPSLGKDTRSSKKSPKTSGRRQWTSKSPKVSGVW